MSSFITFPGPVSARVWNSTFKTILSKLEDASNADQLAARILEENPMAAPIGGLNLTTLTDHDIHEFIRFISSLRDNATTITSEWSTPTNIAQFPTDLDATIEEANKACRTNRP
jgi:hypothetical protein